MKARSSLLAIARPLILVAVAAIAVVVVIALPSKPEPLEPDPAEEADAMYRGFLDQMASVSSQPADATDRTGSNRRPIERNLFRPADYRPAVDSAIDTGARPSNPARGEPVLSGLLVDGARRFAVIDGRTVSEGDSVSGFWVTEISSGSVVLWKNGAFSRLDWSETP